MKFEYLFIKKIILNSLNKNHYSYIDDFFNLSKYYEKDKYFSSFLNSKIFFCETISKEIDRIKLLKYIFRLITNGLDSKEEQIINCLIFAQKHFYHHFGYHACFPEKNIIQDPLANLIFKACRCGNSARFIVDLLLVNGFKARLLSTKSHTFAEVFLNKYWRLIDTNIFPPGIFPKGSDNSLLKISELCKKPEILDSYPSFINYHSLHRDLYKKYFPINFKKNCPWFYKPLHPSSAYFGEFTVKKNKLANYFENNKIRRYEKSTKLKYWNRDKDFGWNNLYEKKSLEANSINFSQRPQEIKFIKRNDNFITWRKHNNPDNKNIDYFLNIGLSSRDWDYKKIKDGFNFEINSEFKINTKENFIRLNDELFDKKLFITITSKYSSDKNKFSIPSKEFIISPI